MLFEKVSETVGFLKGKTTYRPKVAVILGSGFGRLYWRTGRSGLQRYS